MDVTFREDDMRFHKGDKFAKYDCFEKYCPQPETRPIQGSFKQKRYKACWMTHFCSNCYLKFEAIALISHPAFLDGNSELVTMYRPLRFGHWHIKPSTSQWHRDIATGFLTTMYRSFGYKIEDLTSGFRVLRYACFRLTGLIAEQISLIRCIDNSGNR